MNNKIHKTIRRIVISAAIMSAAVLYLTYLPAFAAGPYESYSYDSRGEAIPSQAGYVPEKTVSGYDLGVGAMRSPSDIFFAEDGTFYIADSGNDRIISANSDLTSAVKVYTEFRCEDGTITTLNRPKGVYFSSESGLLYIADSENSRVLVVSGDGTVAAELTRPDSELYTAPTFKPFRVIADKAGNVYTVVNNTMGAAMFSSSGEFMGFYGANRVQPTAEAVREHIRGFFMSEEKRLKRVRNIPAGITSFDICGDFIFTCTSSSSQQTDTVKKLNAAGKNILEKLNVLFGDKKPMYDTSKNQLLSSAIVDIDISEDGSINCLDLTSGRIFRYDEECELMFIIGGKAEQFGGFDTAAAVESRGDRLYAADSAKNTITVFRETAFGSMVNRAAALYNDGYYEEALEPWYEVLRLDGNYRRANIGVASALLRKGDYSGAMKYARLADSPELYNKAFEGYRREFVKAHFREAVFLVAAAAVLIAVIKRRRRRGGRTK